jgi:c-di-GMP-binding flagellar brake protein YcgR
VDERRNSERIDAYQVGLAAVNDVDGEQLGVIGNLSLGGMMLIANQQLQADGILQLKIDVPKELGSGLISMGVKILWCTPANSPKEYWAGLETIDISDTDRDSLQLLLDQITEAH